MKDRSELDDLKARLDLAALARHYGITLRPVGKNLVARCPFGTHEDSEASFTVNPERQLFNCFGCQTGGDSVRFLQLKENCDFQAALARLGAPAEMVEVPTPAPSGMLPVRSTGASRALTGQAAAVARLAAADLVVDCTCEGLLHAPELPAVLAGGARVRGCAISSPAASGRKGSMPTSEAVPASYSSRCPATMAT